MCGSLSSGERAPYLLLLEIEASAKGYTPFAQFFDPLFARWSQDHADASDSRTFAAARAYSLTYCVPGGETDGMLTARVL